MSMKLYMHPVSNASRPVLLFIAEKKLGVENKVVDLMKGEHLEEHYTSINPSRMVPMLEDGDFRLTESSAILKYLASKFDLPEYPTDLKKRARVDEAMDWFNTQFYRDFGYGVVYPQVFPNHKRPNDTFHNGVIEWGIEKSASWFKVLDTHWLGNGNAYLTGNDITIADYFGASLATIGEVVRCDFSHLPNVSRWLGNMKKLSSWNQINEAMMGFREMVKDQPFKAIKPA
ncbi:MAG: glutathione S-transferase family protein [Deltaproteobacteria bacterium]|nr:glutathione S-transferase family protein [Deltaproteobacteria bacterium]